MLLQDLYNRVLGFFRQTDIEKESTKETACNRLRVVLMQDRTNLTPELLERMRGELVELLSKYLEMDKEALELNLEQDGEQVALMLSIPVIRAKDEEEIKAALEAADKQSENTKDKIEEKSKESDESNETDETVSEDDDKQDEIEDTTENMDEVVIKEESNVKNSSENTEKDD